MADPGAASARLRQRDLGVERCRQEKWEEALPWLAGAFADGFPEGRGWPVAGSYLAYCIARCQRRHDEALRLCGHALKVEVFQAEIWLNLARIHLLVGRRREAVEAIRRGLAYDPEHQGLQRLRAQLGLRRRPLLPFLDRSHFLNRTLGRLRRGSGR